MRLFTKARSYLLSGSALALVAACSQADVEDVASPGTTGPVTVIDNGGGGGATGFAARATAPTTSADCPTGTTFDPAFQLPNGSFTTICKLDASAGPITGNVNIPFSADPIVISGAVFVGDGTNNGSVTIAPGQVLFGAGAADAFFVSPGSQIFAVGNAASPIVFTSFQDLSDNGQPDGSSNSAEWGGLAISGRAPINDCTIDTSATPGSAACLKDGEGSSGQFGGNNPNDNSGTLRYVRVQQSGILFNSTNELNGVAFQGVGDGTTVEYLQVHKTADDGVEVFGGTVNARYLVVTGAEDDSIDWTDGWTGSLQFAIVQQLPGLGNRGIEADNREGAADLSPPRSNPNLSNFTFIGSNVGAENDGIKLRRGTAGTLINGIVTNFALDGFDFDADSTTLPTINSILFAGNGVDIEASSGSQALFAAGANNQTASSTTLTGLVPGSTEAGVTPIDPTTVDPSFFTPANYIGAVEDENDDWFAGWTVGLGAAASGGCPTGTLLQAEAVPAGRTESNICAVQSPVRGDVTLTRGNLYVLQGSVFVGEDLGADPAAPLSGGTRGSLTIQPGVTVFGNTGEDALFVSRGSQIFANGTAAEPIILTSRPDVFGGSPDAADWGGLVLNGRAPINDCTVDTSATPGAVDCEKDGEGGSGLYGGATPDDNSGRLNYVRVQYAGNLINSTNELNGIAFQGVGSGTEVDYIQVHANADDGVEVFGGTVDVKHVVITDAQDDSIDWTDGWQGTMQFAIVAQNDGAVNRLIEADNREGAADQGGAEGVRSTPNMANMTLVGFDASAPGDTDGVKLRRGTAGNYYNNIITRTRDEALDFDADSAIATPLFFTSLIIDTTPDGDGNGTDSNAEARGVFDAANGNVDKTATVRTMTIPTGFITPLVPGAEEAIAPTTSLSTVDGRFVDADYVGAIEDASDDWYVGWTLSGSF
ncbi:MAG: hypothetical protein GC152_04990 [Alphaproteobacteria bacterium]|nr:hypothetical protein [Alphaproteobacteria bacterium]